MSHHSTRAAVLVLLALITACSDPNGPRDPTQITYAAELNVDLPTMTRTSTGLYYLDEVIGPGDTVLRGDRVTVHYTGWLPNGHKFDSSVDRGQTLSVSNIGQANLIAGWNEGLPGMRVGGRRLLVIPSHLGYGGVPQGAIPAHSTLVFRVEMIATTR